MKLSVLIPSLTERKELLSALVEDLKGQALDMGASAEVEVLTLTDDGRMTVGEKRNRLLGTAKGEFVAFVDDDDLVSGDYVYEILAALKENPTVDCLGMRGIMTVGGGPPHQVIYSLHNRGGYAADGTYHRPPGHLTPVRRTVVERYAFPEKSLGEDFEWADRILRDQAVKSEAFVDKVLYHYRFNPSSSGTMKAFNIPPPAGRAADVHVVVLSANPNNLRRCLGALFRNEPALPKDHVIVVDDGAGMELERVFPEVTWVKGVKPFVFARNANIGIGKAPGDVLLLNDDARLATRFGVLSLAYAARARDEVAICSAAIAGFVGNPAQLVNGRVPAALRYADSTLAFVAAFIPRATFERVGPLDERFTGYGFEDNDYCTRCFNEGLSLAVYDGCTVEHEKGDSTFRSRPDIRRLFDQNMRIFKEKWGDQALA